MHGGAGRLPAPGRHPRREERARGGLLAALEAGGAALAAGGAALDAVVAAVRELERCGEFNAGRGCVLDADGEVGLDASVMDGAGRRAGGVIGVRRVAQPVDAAAAVLRDGRHVLLAGEGAERFAEAAGLAPVAPQFHVVERRRRKPREGKIGGTVGAVARDAAGRLAAATSTGGLPRRVPGRVSDSALPGAGTWADARCAVSATGLGEFFIRGAFAHEVAARLHHAGADLATACAEALAEVAELGGSGGCIAVDAAGRVALPFDTRDMPRGVLVAGAAPRVVVYGSEDLAWP